MLHLHAIRPPLVTQRLVTCPRRDVGASQGAIFLASGLNFLNPEREHTFRNQTRQLAISLAPLARCEQSKRRRYRMNRERPRRLKADGSDPNTTDLS